MSVPPTLISATPGDNSSAVAVGSNIVLTFSENVFFGSGTLLVSDGASQSYLDKSGLLQTRWLGATDVRSVSTSDSQISISGNTVTINLANDLHAGLNYSVYLPRGFLVDSNNLPFAGLLDSSKLNFTTAGGASPPTAQIGATIGFEDSGISNSDYITNAAAQTVHGTYTGTLGAGESVQVSVDNGQSWQSASASGGNWYCSSFDPLTGSSSLVARVINGQGISSGSVSHSYTFDNTGPSVTAIVLNDTTVGAGETLTLTLTFSEAVNNFSLLNATADSSTYGAFVSVDNGLHWSTTITPNALTDASTVIDDLSISGTDAAGNPHTSGLIQVPTYAVHTAYNLAIGSLSNDAGASSHDFVTNASQQTIAGTLAGSLPATSHVQVSLDGGSSWANATVNNGSGTWQYSGATLLVGSHTVQARVIDANNHTSTPVSHNYTLDTAGGSFSTSSPAQGENAVATSTSTIVLHFDEAVYMDVTGTFLLSDGNAAHDQHLGVEAGDVSVTGSDVTLTLQQALDPGANYQLALDGGFIKDLAGNLIKNASNTDLSAGSGSVGLLSFHTFQDVVITPPATPGLNISDSATGSDPGSESSDGVTRDQTVYVTNLTGGSVGWEYSLNAGSSWNAGSGSSFILPEGSYGANQILVHQVDGTQLSSNYAYAAPLVVDVTAPAAGLSPDLTSFSTSASPQTITGGYSFTDNSDVIIEVSFDLGSSWSRATLGPPSGNSNTWSVIGTASQPIIARITDAAGNLSGVDGSSHGEAVIGSSGADTFATNSGQLQYGGTGNDIFTISSPTIPGRIAGGAGTDTLNINFSTSALNLNNYSSSNVSGIDVLNVSGAHVTLSINDAAILDSWTDDNAGNHTLTINGNGTTVVNLWGANFTLTGSDASYTTLTHTHGGHNDILVIGNNVTYYLTPP